ncbi:MAG TPA: hypothetical protein VFE47_08645, partial [Tepidisphaeraceae bacterium]|nr:hypothetical protein [Tepidisphaeraceae bacterium]
MRAQRPSVRVESLGRARRNLRTAFIERIEDRVLLSTIAGFGDFSGFSVNQTDSIAAPTVSTGSIVITNQNFAEERSVFFKTPVNISAFTASFTYQASAVSAFDLSGGGAA